MTVSTALATAEASIEDENSHLPLLTMGRSVALLATLLRFDDLLFGIHEEPMTDEVHARGVKLGEGMDILLEMMTAKGGTQLPTLDDFPSQHDTDLVRHVDAAFSRAILYAPFRYIVRLAYKDRLSPLVKGRKIIANEPGLASQYVAYSVLTQQRPAHVRWDSLRKLLSGRIVFSADKYTPSVDPRVLSVAHRQSEEMLKALLMIPDSWRLASYTFGEFRAVATALHAKALVHYLSRSVLARKGKRYPFNRSNLAIEPIADLENDLSTVSGVDVATIKSILRNLTFGYLTKTPDISLQPLFLAGRSHYLFCPSHMLINRFERNHCALANRLDPEKQAYQQITNKKEGVMYSRLTRGLPKGLRAVSGRLPSLVPDIDLALVDDHEKVLLVCELKWFIVPSSPREEEDRDEEIEKGISQAIQIRDLLKNWTNDLESFFGIPAPSRTAVAVISPSAGTVYIDRKGVPTVVEEQFCQGGGLFTKTEPCLGLDNLRLLPSTGGEGLPSNDHQRFAQRVVC
jgi:hypothetical protein